MKYFQLNKIWDTVGTERFPKSIAVQYYRRADCCMLVYSVNNETSFQSLEFWKNEFLLHKGINNKSHFPFVVVGNKTDAYLQV